MTIQPVIPAEWIERVMRYWWIVVLAGILGGVVGVVAHLFTPPVYQAQAVINSSVDFSYTGELTDVEEDYMIQAVGGVIRSDEVSEAAYQAVKAAGIPVDQQEFEEMRSLQRRFVDWLLVVQHTDAQTAVDLANIWADAAWVVLDEANNHASILGGLLDFREALSSCLMTKEEENEAQPVCEASSLEEIQAELDRVKLLIEEEKLASRGLVPGTVTSFTQNAVFPASPTLLGRNTLVLAGALIGLLVGLAGVVIWGKN